VGRKVNWDADAPAEPVDSAGCFSRDFANAQARGFPEESARQRQAYLAFIRTRSKHVIVDASQSLNKVIADVEQAITETILENDSNCE